MTYEAVLAAIADPTRRTIINALRPGPLSVSQIAAPLPVSRPAVSQHLKVLKAAQLVTMERLGTRNLYALSPAGLDAMRQWLDVLWQDALDSFAREAESRAASSQSLPPVTKTLHVRLSPPEAFTLFTEDIALWWPVSTHSQSAQQDGALPISLIFQNNQGGKIIETLPDGSAETWGAVTEWSPGHALTLAWHVGRPADQATTLSLRFDNAGRGTKLTLLHDNWEAMGAQAETIRAQYDTGWDHVLLERYSAAAAAALSNF